MSLIPLVEILRQTLGLLPEEEAPVGTVHHWSNGDHRKVGPHQWVPTRAGSSDSKPEGPKGSGHLPKHAPPPLKSAHTSKPSPQAPLPFGPAKPAEAKADTDETRLPGAEDPWIPKAKDLPENTARAYSRNGVYTPERAALHAKIVKERLDKVPPPPAGKRPVAILLMGLMASGKSGIRKGLIGDGSDFVVVDADEIKGELPEFQKAVDQRARNAGSIVHEESSNVASQLKRAAVKSGRNVVLDGSGRVRESYEESIRHLKKSGYDIHLLMAHCDTETAVKRAEERGKATGRWIDPAYLRSMDQDIPRNFRALRHQVDNFSLFDTNTFPPKPLWTKAAGAETVHDPEAVDGFRKIGSSRRESYDYAAAAHAHLRFVVEGKEGEEPAVSPDEIVKRARRATQPKLPAGKPFAADRGITEPEPDDAALAGGPSHP